MVYVPMVIGKVGAMFFLYILQSEKSGRYYIGCTNDLSRRLIEHNAGKTASLKNLRPLKLVFQQEYREASLARRMELRLKKLKSRVILDRIIRDQRVDTGS